MIRKSIMMDYIKIIKQNILIEIKSIMKIIKINVMIIVKSGVKKIKIKN